MAIQSSYPEKPFNVIVSYYYKGVLIDNIAKFIQENPALHGVYAKSQMEVYEKRIHWYENTTKGYKTVIKVSEDGFTVHPNDILIR